MSLPWVGVAVDVVRLAPIQHGKSKTQLVTQVPTESGIIGSGQSLAISQVNLSTRRRGDNYSVLRHRRRGRRVQVACVPSVLAVCSREHEGQPVARGAVNSQRLQRQSIVTHQPAYITGVLDRNLIQTCAVFFRECLTAPRRGAFRCSGQDHRGDFHGSSLLQSFSVCVCLSLPWVVVAVDVGRLAPIQHGKSETQPVTQVPTEKEILGQANLR